MESREKERQTRREQRSSVSTVSEFTWKERGNIGLVGMGLVWHGRAWFGSGISTHSLFEAFFVRVISHHNKNKNTPMVQVRVRLGSLGIQHRWRNENESRFE